MKQKSDVNEASNERFSTSTLSFLVEEEAILLFMRDLRPCVASTQNLASLHQLKSQMGTLKNRKYVRQRKV